MFYLIVTVHFFLCFMLVGLVLVQQGKGADMGATFGSGGSNSLFGAAGAAPTIVKLTAGVCILFMVTSVLLIRNYAEYAGSVRPIDALEGSVFTPETGTAPATMNTDSSATDGAATAGTAEQPAADLGTGESAAADSAVEASAAAAPAANPAGSN
jgi:preprotein translocase subunit SecG